jgi:PTS system ascorbate-specific IIA component
MIGILLIAHRHIAEGLLAAARHTLGKRPPRLEALEIDYRRPVEEFAAALAAQVRALDNGQGLLILSDVFGATHTNIACRHLRRGQIELISGVNLPMLLKVINYRELPMEDVMDKALSGGCGGIVCAGEPDRRQERGA